MSGIRIGLLISLSERYVLALVSLASSMIVARLLSPEEIGIYSVSVAVIAIAQVLRDFGVGSFLVQVRELTEDVVRTAFGLSLIVGVGLFAIVFAMAPIAARFYAEPALIETLFISSFNFLILPFCSISMAILRREMRFKQIAIVNVVAAIAGAIAVVTAARMGAGPNSMAISSIVLSLTTGLGTWFARENARFLLPSLSRWRELLKYSSQATAASAVTSVSVNSNDLVLGKVLGFGPVAILSRAQGLMNLFHRDMMTAVRNVAFPAFANAHRNNEQLEPRYISSVTALTAFAWPFYGILALFPLEITRLLFGDQWDLSVPLVPVFAIAGAVSATVNLAQPLVIASGRIDLATRAELIVQPMRFALIAVTAVVFESVFACAMAYLAMSVVSLPVFYWFKGKVVKNDFRQLLSGLGKSGQISLLTLLVPGLVSLLGDWSRTTPLSLTATLGAMLAALVAWPISLQLFAHPLTRDPAYLKLKQRLLGDRS